jgi:hypothetical protein
MRAGSIVLLVLAASLGVAFSARSARADPLPAHAQRVVSYSIDVTLDVPTHTLTGVERVIWRNPSSDAVADLWLHLYLNAFRNTRSTFFRESGGQLRDVRMPDQGWGWTDITRMTLADGTDLLPVASIEALDDGNHDDRTVMRVRLPQPVPPDGQITLAIAFTARLPRIYARTGYAGDYHLVGQWFPKIAVYEPAGVRGRTAGGWNCHQFHANSEFYADYGSFDVRITLPARFVVGATGQLVGSTKNADGTVTWHYAQDDVHDFAWTADPKFVEVKDYFSGTRDVTDEEYRRAASLVGRPIDEMRLSDVNIRLLMQPAHLPQARRYLDAIRAAIKRFGLWYGRYPYPTLTIVDPAYGGLGSGGMEYPTFITAGTSLLLNGWPFERVRIPEDVTVHEYGHQYWYGLAGSNEFEEAWLDEGITSYSTGRVMDRVYGADTSVAALLGLHVGETDELRVENAPSLVFDRIRQPAWTYSDSYGFYSYTKPALMLETLERMLGEPTMAKVMRTYAERWRFRHPSSDDFYAVANEVSGRDLSSFFRQVVEGTDVVDYEVASLSSEKTPADEGRLSTSTMMTSESAPSKTAPYTSKVLVRRRGGVVMPQIIQLTFEKGRVERIDWNGEERWKKLTRVTPDRLLTAQVDPDHRIWLDANWVNNSRRVTPDRTVAVTWTARALFWVQQLISIAGI